MKYKNGDEELYDMLKDSKQFENLATNLEYKNQLSKVRSNIPAGLVMSDSQETAFQQLGSKPTRHF